MPILLVFRKVWIPYIASTRNMEIEEDKIKDVPPMKVIFRIAGFEGEVIIYSLIFFKFYMQILIFLNI